MAAAEATPGAAALSDFSDFFPFGFSAGLSFPLFLFFPLFFHSPLCGWSSQVVWL